MKNTQQVIKREPKNKANQSPNKRKHSENGQWWRPKRRPKPITSSTKQAMQRDGQKNQKKHPA
jgi:hypothetical protein